MKKIKIKLPKFLPILGWSDSKLHLWEKCPLQCQLRSVLHLCVHCFRGSLPYGDGALCPKCHRPHAVSPALQRGRSVDEVITKYLTGGVPIAKVYEEYRPHPTIPAALRDVRGVVKRARARVQFQVVLDSAWRTVSQFTKNAWLRCKLDVLVYLRPSLKVIDWKTGGIDKHSGTIRESPEYDDQMDLYSVVALVAEPDFAAANSELVFLDAPPGVNPVRRGKEIRRNNLERAKERWEARVKPMLSDRTFAPRPGWYCDYCDYSKTKGGPCPVA
jgi:hypothetical protein